MENFVYHNPTKIVFGKGSIGQLADLVPATERVLLTYGGGSIKSNGVYDQVKKALAGRAVLEFGGIQPNPLYETLMEAVKIVREQKITLLLAVGGGSVLDGTKFVAAAARFGGAEPWDICSKGAAVADAVPMGAVLTLPATGSESNGFAVISRKSSGEKLAFGSPLTYPKFAILDPSVTESLPQKQVRNGIIDAFVHVMEQYANPPADAALQDRQAEAILVTLIEQGPRALANKADYAARANLVWSATQALNGLIACGVPQDWATHMIGHELTAFYGLDHAETLSIVMPSLMRHQMKHKRAKLAQMARRVWGLQETDDARAAEQAVAKCVEFFHSLGMKTRLADYGIQPADAAKKVADRFRSRNTVLGDITPEGTKQILEAC